MASEIMYRNEISMSQKVSIKTNVYLLKTNVFFASYYTLQYIFRFLFLTQTLLRIMGESITSFARPF